MPGQQLAFSKRAICFNISVGSLLIQLQLFAFRHSASVLLIYFTVTLIIYSSEDLHASAVPLIVFVVLLALNFHKYHQRWQIKSQGK